MSAGKTIFVTAVDEVFDSEKDNLGDIRFENGKVYKYVEFDGAATAKKFVVYENTAGYGASKVAEATAGLGAGVVMATAADGDFGWIQIAGLAELADAVGGSPSIGEPVMRDGSNAGQMTKAGTAGNPVSGFFLDATANEVLLSCPF